MNEDNNIGILLNSSRFTQVGKHRPVILSLLNASVQLGQGNDRNVQLTRQGFQGAGDFRNFLLPVVGIPAADHQLQVVDENRLDVMVQLIFSGSRSQFGKGNSGRIVYDHFRPGNDAGNLDQVFPFFIGQLSGTDILCLDVRFHRDQTVHQLFL